MEQVTVSKKTLQILLQAIRGLKEYERIDDNSDYGQAEQAANAILNGWKPMSELEEHGFTPTKIVELLSLDGKTGSLAVMIAIPGQRPINSMALLDERDGTPCFVPVEQYSGWRPYVYVDPSD
jgi:hypothetical protein